MKTSRGASLLIENGWCCFQQSFRVSDIPESEIKNFGFNEMFALQTIEKVNIKQILKAPLSKNEDLLKYLTDDEVIFCESIENGAFNNLINEHRLKISFDENGIFQAFVLESKNITSFQVPAFGIWIIKKIEK